MTEDLSLYLRGDPLASGQVMACPAPRRLRGSQVEQIAYGNGAQGRDRTTDTAIFSRMLYQLSYLGVAPNAARGERRFIVRQGRAVQPSAEFPGGRWTAGQPP